MAEPTKLKRRKIIRMSEVEELTTFTRDWIKKLGNRGLFPKSFKIIPGGHAAGFFEDEVLEWIEQRKQEKQHD